MADQAPEITFAYLQLGLPHGSSTADVEAALNNAKAYKFATRERVKTFQRMLEFFHARSLLGHEATSFADIRKAYHRKAMDLHPDRNIGGDHHTEEELKALNAAYALVEDINREARDYFRLSETYRRETEDEARQAILRERPQGASHQAPPRPQRTEHHTPVAGKKFMAASVPRSIRNTRLSHIPVGRIIGSWYIEVKNDLNQVFDVIMLPELEFTRMKLHLSVQNAGNPTFERSSISPAYILKDTKEIVVPEGTPNPYDFAKGYFVEQFKLPQRT